MAKKYLSGDWLLDAEKRLLTPATASKTAESTQSTVLEPRVFALLVYFLTHPERTINRDELIEEVWEGTNVSESAINWTIAQLRKSLGDKATPRQYIQTLSKQGYQWLPSVKIIEEAHKSTTVIVDDQQPRKPSTPLYLRQLAYLTAFALMAILVGVLTQNSPTSSETELLQGQIRPFTSLIGAERQPTFSPDGKWLAFTHYQSEKGSTRLMIKPIKEDVEFIQYNNQNQALPQSEISQRLLPETEIGKPSRAINNLAWAPHGKKLAYMRWQDGQCEIRLLSLNTQMQKTGDEVVHSCHPDGYSQVTWGIEADVFYFTDRLENQAYQVFRYDFKTQQTKAIGELESMQNGVFLVRASPTQMQAVQIIDQEGRSSEFRLMDLKTGESEHLFTRKGQYFDIDWNLNGDAFFFNQSQQQLFRFDIVEKRISLFYGDPRNEVYGLVQSPHSNVFALVHASANRNRIDSVDLTQQLRQPTSFIDSSFQERRPLISHDGQTVYFESDRSGIPQIWQRDLNGNEQQVSNITEYMAIGSIRLSQNDRILVGESDFNIRTIDFDKDVSWSLSDNTIKSTNPIFVENDTSVVFSQLTDGTWQLVKVPYNDKLESPEKLTRQGGYYATSDGNSQIYYTKKDECGIYSISSKDKNEELVHPEACVSNNSLTLVKNWLYFENFEASPNGIYRWNIVDGRYELVLNRTLYRGNGFAISDTLDQLLIHRYNKSESDILIIEQ